MENLEEIFCTSSTFAGTSKESPKIVRAVHHHSGTSFLVTKKRIFVYKEEISCGPENVYILTDLRHPLQYVSYLHLPELVFLATDRAMILYDLLTKKIISNFMFEFTIKALAWNPSQTALVILTAADDLMLFLTFDNTLNRLQFASSISLHSEPPVPQSSGWAVPEAQFRGPRAKNIKDPAKASAIVRFTGDPPHISWRGNGEQFVVNYAKDNFRYVKVFSHDLTPLFQSEKFDSLGPLVAFQSCGQLFACYGLNAGEFEIYIFEKNCKIKSSFKVPEIEGTIKKLQYHQQLNMLGILSIDSELNSFINIYVCYNTRWYLKQQLFYLPEQRVIDFVWALADERALTAKLVVITIKKIQYHLFRFVMSRNHHSSTVLVTNGNKIQIYQFDCNIIPPISPINTFQTVKPINKIIFHPREPWCLLIDPTFTAHTLNFSLHLPTSHFINQASISNLIDTERFCIEDLENVQERDVFKLTPVKENFQENEDYICIIPYNETYDDKCYTSVCYEFGKTLTYICKKKIVGDDSGFYELMLFNNLDLYANGIKVCTGVTSVMMYKNFLIFTHVESKLYFVRVDRISVLEQEFDLDKIFSLNIDQGGKLVHCNNFLPPKVILYIPRGNLEVFSCMIITIDMIEQLLQDNKWKEVIAILKLETVNSNVLIDLNPERFITNVEHFVQATESYNNLISLVNDFNVKENCFNTVYKNYFRMPSKHFNKKDVITKIVEYLIRTNSIANLKSIVAILYRHNSLKDAVKVIKEVYFLDKITNLSVCGEVIKQLLIRVDQNELIATAFSLYEMDFVKLVYLNSMEDPRVYLPLLEKLINMPITEQRFHMNVKAGKPENALKYLISNENADADFVTNFIVRHNLESAAYDITSEIHKSFEAVTQCYAIKLRRDRKYLQAGFVFKRGKFFEEALLDYKKALEWREVIVLLKKLQYPEERCIEILNEIAEELLAAKKINEAIVILEFYTRNHKRALKAMMDFKQFRQAVCYIKTYPDDTIMDDLLPVIKEYLISLEEKLKLLQRQYSEYFNRLIEVRREKTARFDLTNIDEPMDDIQSETSSTSSMRSIGSTASRNLRKQEKKKTNLRKGGRFEDIALMRALHMLYGEVLELSKSFCDICLIEEHFSWHFCSRMKARLKEFKESMTRNTTEIWPKDFLTPPLSKEPAILALVENKEELDPVYATPPSNIISNEAWVAVL